MATTVLVENPTPRAMRRADALSQASRNASSKRLLKGAFPSNCGTISAFTPERGQRSRYS
jgi:hypothetical protein